MAGFGAFLVQIFGHKKTYKIEIQFLVGVLARKEGDSNPRRCYPQRFSRPPQSTALPSFLILPLRVANVQIYPFTYAILTIKLPRGFYLFIRLLDFDEFLLGGNSLTI